MVESSNYDFFSMYSYDNDGNIMSVEESNDYRFYTYNGNKLSSAEFQSKTLNYYYDYRGNVTKKQSYGQNGYTMLFNKYNYMNLPLQTTIGSYSYDYSYDETGQRLSKKGGNYNDYYIRDFMGREIGVYDNITKQMRMFNIYGQGMVGRIEPKFVLKNGVDPEGEPYSYYERTDKRFYYINDHLGSIRLTINEDNTISSAQDYNAFGGILPGRSYVSGSAMNMYKFTGKERDTETNLDYFGARYYDSEIGRWLSVDPLADKYPGWSPYNYTLNSPLRYIDPNGMWTADYDKDNNIVTVKYQDGDTYEGLYTQLGMSADDFSNQYKVDLTSEITAGATFDITEKVLTNTNFNGSFDGSNCFGFVSTAIGANTGSERQVQGMNFLKNISNPSATTTPTTGSVAVWNYTGDFSAFGEQENTANTPAHAAIYVITNQAGEQQFLNRETLGAPVSINTNSQIQGNYSTIKSGIEDRNPGLVLPGITSSPTFYQKRK